MADTPNTAPTPAAATPAQAGTPPPAPPVEAAKAAPEAQKQPAAAEIKKMKLKLDGAEVELPEEEVIRLAQLSGGAQKKFMEAASERQKIEKVIEMLEKNPKEALARLGHDLKKFSEETLAEILNREKESPEQKQIREQSEKLRKYEEAEKASEAAEAKKAEEAAVRAKQEAEAKKQQAIVAEYQAKFLKALDEAGVPKSPWAVGRLAQMQGAANKSGMKVDATHLAKLLKEDYDSEHRSRIDSYRGEDKAIDGSKLLDFLGEEATGAIKRALITKLKGQQSQKFSKPAPESDKPVANTMSWRDLQKKNRFRS